MVSVRLVVVGGVLVVFVLIVASYLIPLAHVACSELLAFAGAASPHFARRR